MTLHLLTEYTVWLMHCHIGWHVSMGFALQIIENKAGIKETVTDSCQLQDTCKSWNSYAKAKGIVVNDSGVDHNLLSDHLPQHPIFAPLCHRIDRRMNRG